MEIKKNQAMIVDVSVADGDNIAREVDGEYVSRYKDVLKRDVKKGYADSFLDRKASRDSVAISEDAYDMLKMYQDIKES